MMALKSFKYKITFYFAGIFLFFSLGFMLISIDNHIKMYKQAEDNKIEHVLFMINELKNKQIEKVNITAKMLSSSNAFNQLFIDGKRDELQTKLKGIFGNLKKEFFIDQLHYHKPNAVSFLRLHDPLKHSDNLASFRKTIVEVQANKKPVIGVEEGKAGFAIRAVYPIFDSENQFQGSLEVGTNLDKKFISFLLKHTKASLAVYLAGAEKKLIYKTPKFKTELFKKHLANFKEHSYKNSLLLTDNGEDYLTFCYPLKSFDGKVIGIIGGELKREDFKSALYLYVLKVGIAAFLGLVVFVLIAFFISSKINKPVQKITHIAKEVAQGNFAQNKIEYKSSDEIGVLAQAFNTLIYDFNILINKIRVKAKTILDEVINLSSSLSQGSVAVEKFNISTKEVEENSKQQLEKVSNTLKSVDEIASNISVVSSNIDQQSSAVEEFSATMEELTASIKSIAEISKNAKTITDDLTQKSSEGSKVIQKVIIGVKDVGASNQEIIDILNVITEIAEQTNLLAMNAAIEAAHAGEFGKGFAVVAEEIRKLAEKSAKSSKEIHELITTIISKIENSVDAGQQAEIKFGEIRLGIQQTANINGEIYVATQEQATGINETLDAISSILDSTKKIQASFKSIEEDSSNIRQITSESQIMSKENALAANEQTDESHQILDSVLENRHSVEQIKNIADDFYLMLDNYKTQNLEHLIEQNEKIDLSGVIEWSDQFSVNVQRFDEQHKKWIGFINKLYKAMKEGKGAETLSSLMHDMTEYTKIHLKDEEKILKESGYPAFDEHKKIHDEFTNWILEIEQRFNSGDHNGLSLEVITKLKDWLINHINRVDKRYSDHLHQYGMK